MGGFFTLGVAIFLASAHIHSSGICPVYGVFSSLIHLKIFGFWFIILQNGTKYHEKFLAKMYPFSILDFGLKKPHSPYEKFDILDKTKHTHKNFGILHFIISK
jgi:hypothetical protein